jgi:tetratricopeptide (TPR) repeat protein
MTEAQALFDAGKVRYERGDYRGAIDLWTEAVDGLPEFDPAVADVRSALIFNLAVARFKQYELDGDLEQLEPARALLERYRAGLPDDAASDRETADSWLARIDEALAKRREGNAGPTPPPRPTPPAHDDVHGPMLQRERERVALGLAIGGGVAMAGGLGLFGAMAAGLVRIRAAERDGEAIADASPEPSAGDLADPVARGEAAQRLAIATGATGGVLVAAGATMLAIGLTRGKRRRSAAVPMAGPSGAGLRWMGRF